ncbi:MAG: hypothetical protein HOH04_04550 [Rhodospirillaceae bacterium]|nr:hypothetical protein [Rhodospirillaceae bacterium]
MKITTTTVHLIPVNHRGCWVLVEIATDQGLSGWGEGSHSGDDTACMAAIERIGAELAATGDIDPLAAAAGLMDGVSTTSRAERTPPSAIAQALIDLAARARGIAVAELLTEDREQGAPNTVPAYAPNTVPVYAPKTVPVYANVNRMCAERDPATIAAAGQLAVRAGINAVKLAPFDEVSPEALEAQRDIVVAPGIERLQALRQGIGADVKLMVDCHWRFTHDFAPLLADIAKFLDIQWIEDPFDNWNRTVADDLRKASDAQITGGEDIYTLPALERLAQSGCVDVLIADVKFVGGTAALDRMCKMAASHGVGFAPHNPSGPLSTAASAHVAAANANALIVEYPFGEVDWRAELAPGEILNHGGIQVAGPGYGIDIRPRDVRPSDIRPKMAGNSSTLQ